VICVDVDTTKSKIVFDREVMASSTHWPPIIWAQNAIQEDGLLKPQPVLDGVEPQPPTALAFFPIDDDRMVRRYSRMLPTVDGEKISLPWALVRTFCSVSPGNHHPAVCQHIDDSANEEESPIILRFSAGRHINTRRISANDLLALENSDGWKTNSPIKGQIAIIGGVFNESPDWYETPFGRLPGAELVAQAVETELPHRAIKPEVEAFMFLVEIAGGFLLVIGRFFAPAFVGFAFRVLAVPGLAVASSYLVFLSRAHWANFVPILVGVILHECYDHWREYRKLRASIEPHSLG
jgi:CHASE2 domain-containing sensor protein